MDMSSSLRSRTPQVNTNVARSQSFESPPEENLLVQEFSVDQVVWAKIVGHPWWPAVITEQIKSHKKGKSGEGSSNVNIQYRVEFVGSAQHAIVDHSKIEDYLANRQLFIEQAHKFNKKYNQREFEAAVNEADLILQEAGEVIESENQNEGEVNEQELGQEESVQVIRKYPLRSRQRYQSDPRQMQEKTKVVKKQKKPKKPKKSKRQRMEEGFEDGQTTESKSFRVNTIKRILTMLVDKNVGSRLQNMQLKRLSVQIFNQLSYGPAYPQKFDKVFLARAVHELKDMPIDSVLQRFGGEQALQEFQQYMVVDERGIVSHYHGRLPEIDFEIRM